MNPWKLDIKNLSISVLLLILLYCLAVKQWSGSLIIFSVFMVDILISKIQIDNIASFFKLVVASQALLMWFISGDNLTKLHVFGSTRGLIAPRASTHSRETVVSAFTFAL